MMKASSSPKVVVYSDYICPFCFIGKSRIDRLRKEFEVKVDWRNIEIHPETPMDGIPRYKLDSGFYTQLWINVERLAEESGVEIGPPPVLSNSSLALIASQYAKDQGKFEPFHDAVFLAYWQEGKNIGDLNILSAVAEKVGLSPSGLRAYIREGNWEDPIESNRRSAAEHNVSGVPTFIVGRQQLVGAQPYDVIRSAFLKEFCFGFEAPEGR
jgi:predicted DsbA family dithiol-disulfide isomerase